MWQNKRIEEVDFDGNTINITITFRSRKDTTLVYDETLGAYAYHQYGGPMTDGRTGEPETFENVVLMFADIIMNQYGYHEARFQNGGTGYFACGGKIIPITWSTAGNEEPFEFFTLDGEKVPFGIGNTYIAVALPESPVTYD